MDHLYHYIFLVKESGNLSFKTIIIETQNKTVKEILKEYNNNDNIVFGYKNIKNVSDILADYVVDNIDAGKFLKISEKKINKDEIPEFYDFLKSKIDDYLDRRKTVSGIIEKYLNSCKTVNVDGLFNFRLGEYYNIISNIIDEIYEDFQTHMEYDKFISLMKVLIKNGVSIVNHLHIEISYTYKYVIYDDYYNDITEICINEFLEEFKYKYLNKDDFLLSTVLSFSPKIITIHHSDRFLNKELLETLKNIYGENLIIS